MAQFQKTMSTIERFEQYISPEPNSGCWLWAGSALKTGYGSFMLDGKCRRSHRLSYEIYKGVIPEGAHVLHHCDMPCCVNPDHLFLGTHQDNMDDMNAKGRCTHPNGEEIPWAVLTEEAVLHIRKSNESYTALAKQFNVARCTVGNAAKKKTWKSVDSTKVSGQREYRCRGENHLKTKLKETDVRKIKTDLRSTSVIGAEYGVARQVINDIRTGRTWKHVQ